MNNSCSLHSPDMNKYTFKWEECGSILVLTPFFNTIYIYIFFFLRFCDVLPWVNSMGNNSNILIKKK